MSNYTRLFRHVARVGAAVDQTLREVLATRAAVARAKAERRRLCQEAGELRAGLRRGNATGRGR